MDVKRYFNPTYQKLVYMLIIIILGQILVPFVYPLKYFFGLGHHILTQPLIALGVLNPEMFFVSNFKNIFIANVGYLLNLVWLYILASVISNTIKGRT